LVTCVLSLTLSASVISFFERSTLPTFPVTSFVDDDEAVEPIEPVEPVELLEPEPIVPLVEPLDPDDPLVLGEDVEPLVLGDAEELELPVDLSSLAVPDGDEELPEEPLAPPALPELPALPLCAQAGDARSSPAIARPAPIPNTFFMLSPL
jgi:hypothetical protein